MAVEREDASKRRRVVDVDHLKGRLAVMDVLPDAEREGEALATDGDSEKRLAHGPGRSYQHAKRRRRWVLGVGP